MSTARPLSTNRPDAVPDLHAIEELAAYLCAAERRAALLRLEAGRLAARRRTAQCDPTGP